MTRIGRPRTPTARRSNVGDRIREDVVPDHLTSQQQHLAILPRGALSRMNERLLPKTSEAGLNVYLWVESARSDFNSLRKLECVFDIDAKVADGAFDLGVA